MVGAVAAGSPPSRRPAAEPVGAAAPLSADPDGLSASAPTWSRAPCSPPTGAACSRCPSAQADRLVVARPAGVLPLDGLRVTPLAAPELPALRRSRVDTAFREVMVRCGDRAARTAWINPAFVDAYERLHHLGWAHAVETLRRAATSSAASTASASAGCSPASRCSTTPRTRPRSRWWRSSSASAPPASRCSTCSGPPPTSSRWE